MTFVITAGCCNDASCISVCPVQCIRPRPGDPDFTTAEQLYIDPGSCIDCGACVPECPVGVVHADDDLLPEDEPFLQINADYFAGRPATEESPRPVVRRRLPEGITNLRVAVVGSGPAACYVAGELSSIAGTQVSILERLPTPFGLVRAGVAPDHPQTKHITDLFRTTLSRKSVECFFNVEVGRDVSIDELLEHHHAVVWAAGADSDNELGVPGEDLPGSHSAREFVAWYNGHPDHANATFDLSGERVVVVGNGNVALDVARTLAMPAASLENTDLAAHALAALRESHVRDVVVAGRRGSLQAAYTLPELLALAQLGNVDLVARPDESCDTRNPLAARTPSPIDLHKLRIVEEAGRRTPEPRHRTITLRYLLSPLEIHGTDKVEAITFARNRLTLTDGIVAVEDTGETETVQTSLVLRAIGYRGRPVEGLPFNTDTGTVAHNGGRITESPGGTPLPGLYCAGWIKRGATGVIGTNKVDGLETVDALLADLAAGRLRQPAHDADHLHALIANRQPDAIDNAGWLRIDRAELAAGRLANRPRHKFVSIDEMVLASRPDATDPARPSAAQLG